MTVSELVSVLLKEPFFWNLSQLIFGAEKQKQLLYRSLLVKKGKLLDFGCADGNAFLTFKDYDYTGVDIDKKAIKYATDKYRSYPNAKFLCCNILHNNLPKKSFDYVLFSCIGHHLPNNMLPSILKALSRLLKDNGRLIIIDPIIDPKRRSPLLRLIMSLDQGKFHKDESFYNLNLNLPSNCFSVVTHKTVIYTNALMPQPTTYIAELKKR